MARTSPQLRPLLVRLKRHADRGLPSGPREMAAVLSPTPRRHVVVNRTCWLRHEARIARIAGTVDITLERPPPGQLLVFVKSRIATDDADALALMRSIFGPVEQKWSGSPRGGWWSTYCSSTAPDHQLHLTFGRPTQREKQTLFSGAILTSTASGAGGSAP